ncbi:class I SAM-dependent methyltransferase [Caenispirillum bisanense]|uniref:class I SAM-dependent methyltransferase n=1 Tax=Caenispirillum bisanense TaxID=414052 RepID=UPI0031DAEE0D
MAAAMIDPATRETVDAVWGDPAAWEAAGWQWTRLPAISRMINRQVSGDEDVLPEAWFFRRVAQVRPLPLDRVLVLACGGGALERSLVSNGWVRSVVAVDMSARVLAVAEAAARDAGLTGRIDYRLGDMNDLDVDGPFDAVFGVSAVHHCANLKGLFATINKVLVPGGWFFLNDYVGPTRFQWSDADVLQINRLLQLLPDRMAANAAGFTRRGFQRVSAEEVAAFDVTEAVRSADILRVMADHLKVEVCRGYGGSLLHLVLANLGQNFDPAASGDPTGPEYLDLLIRASDHLRATGRSPDYFAAAIARQAST